MAARISPAQEPFSPDVQATIDGVMRGKPALLLFTTLARDRRLFHKFFAAGLLDRGHLTKRQREIVILRTTALCGSEYEWGVHVATFAESVGFSPAQLRSLHSGQASAPCWQNAAESSLVRMCDALHASCTLIGPLWDDLREHFAEEGMLEQLMLAGFYRTVSYLTNALKIPLEPAAARFPGSAAN